GILVAIAVACPLTAFAQSNQIGTYAVFAAGSVTVQSNVLVRDGSVGSNNGSVRLAPSVTLNGGDIAGNLLDLRRAALVNGDGYFNVLQRKGLPPGDITGALHSPITLPILSF